MQMLQHREYSNKKVKGIVVGNKAFPSSETKASRKKLYSHKNYFSIKITETAIELKSFICTF